MTAGGPSLHGWTPETFLQKLAALNRGDRGRAPHKPLLLLWVLACFARDGSTTARYGTARAAVDPLLAAFGATGTRPSTADPFTYLRSEGIWAIEGGEEWTEAQLRQRDPVGGLTPEVAALLRSHPGLAREAFLLLLRTYFLPEQHAPLAAELLFS